MSQQHNNHEKINKNPKENSEKSKIKTNSLIQANPQMFQTNFNLSQSTLYNYSPHILNFPFANYYYPQLSNSINNISYSPIINNYNLPYCHNLFSNQFIIPFSPDMNFKNNSEDTILKCIFFNNYNELLSRIKTFKNGHIMDHILSNIFKILNDFNGKEFLIKLIEDISTSERISIWKVLMNQLEIINIKSNTYEFVK